MVQAQQDFNSAQREANEAQQEFNRTTDQRLNTIEGRLGNIEGGQYERAIRSSALARSLNILEFNRPRMVINQDGLTDPQLTLAIRNRTITQDNSAELFEPDMIISADDNRPAVIEAFIAADQDDIGRGKIRAGKLAAITGGSVTPVVITSRLNPAQSTQAEVAGVTTFVMSYP